MYNNIIFLKKKKSKTLLYKYFYLHFNNNYSINIYDYYYNLLFDNCVIYIYLNKNMFNKNKNMLHSCIL